MSWKLAEWRWREQAPLRERSLWKIWDIEDAVKIGDLVEDVVRKAHHFPDPVDGCWQRRIQTPRGKDPGSIRSGTNPHPPPRCQPPYLPSQHHISYHPSRSSSAPLLGPLKRASTASGESNSTSSLISALLINSTSSTPTIGATPRTPQIATDLLDSRDWNHLVLDQKVDKETAVNQVRSSFGLYTKANQSPRSKQRGHLVLQYHRLERGQKSANQALPRSLTNSFNRRKQPAQDLDALFNVLHNRAIPWSILDTPFEDKQFFVENYFAHRGTVFEGFNPNGVAPELSAEEPSEFYNSFYGSASLVLPKVDMGRFTIGKSEGFENNGPKAKRKDTPPAKVFEDLPAAYSGIVRQSGPPLQEIRNMTGLFPNLPPLIDLPRTPARPGSASPAVQQKLAEAKALRKQQQLISTPERPLTPLLPDNPSLRLCTPTQPRNSFGQDQLEDDTVPAGDFVSQDDRIEKLRRTTSHESMLKDRVLVQNSRSFFDLDREYRRERGQPIQRLGSGAQENIASATSGSADSVIDVYSGAASPRASNVLVRDSCDILGIAISGDRNYSLRGGCRGDLTKPAPLRINRHQSSAGEVPREGLPRIPPGVQSRQYQQDEVLSSEGAQYDNTQSLLNVGRFGLYADVAGDLQTQILRNRREVENGLLRDAGADPATAASSDARGHYSYAADDLGHELSRCGHRQPECRFSGLSQLGVGFDGIHVSAAAPYHNTLKTMYDAVNNNDSETGSPQHAVSSSGQSKDHDWALSRLSEDEHLSQLGVRDQTHGYKDVEEITGQEHSFRHNVGSAEWFANAAKTIYNMEQTGTGAEETEDDGDWETFRGSEIDSDQPQQATLQPPSEQNLPLLIKTDSRTDPSLADISSSGSIPATQDQPVIPWDPIPKRPIRRHPARPGTPHKYRLRKDASTGEEVYVPQYSVPEIGQHSPSNYLAETAQATPDVPAHYLFPISKFSASTPRQQILKEDTSSAQNYPSSPPVFSQGRHKARMAATVEKKDLAQDRFPHELEGDQVCGVGVAISANVPKGSQQHMPEAESGYSLTSDHIVQNVPIDLGAIGGLHPANIADTRATTSNASSDKRSMRDGMQYGEQGGAIEMKRMGMVDQEFSIRTLDSISTGSGYLQDSSSQASLSSQFRLTSQGRHESDDDLFKRLSTIEDDGSYESDEDVASTSSFMREDNPFTPQSGTFNKRAFLGAKHNIIRSLRGTGMRGTDSSPANVSSDVYDPAMLRHHSYGQLSSGPQSVHEAGNKDNTENITYKKNLEETSVRKHLTREQVKEIMRIKGADVDKMAWSNVQKDITGIIFPMGQAISAPKALILPRTVPPVNSFVLTKEQPLRLDTTTQEMAKERIEMAEDDWFRLNQSCPIFPLRDSHLEMKFVESDPRRTGDNIYNRGGISRINGRTEEDAFCFKHNRREFSTIPALRQTPLSAEMERMRKEAGREIVWTCLYTPIVGWVMLYYIWKDEPGMRVDGELMRQKTKGLVQEIGKEEAEFAGRVLLWFGLGFFGVTFAGLAALLWALL